MGAALDPQSTFSLSTYSSCAGHVLTQKGKDVQRQQARLQVAPHEWQAALICCVITMHSLVLKSSHLAVLLSLLPHLGQRGLQPCHRVHPRVPPVAYVSDSVD